MSRVLIIDDEEMVCMTLRLTLEQAGYEVAEATDGEKGLRKYVEFNPDLVITDLIMPNKEGIETIAELRKRFPEQQIIAISGGGRTGNIVLLDIARNLGANATMSKPFDPDEILEKIQELVPNSAQDASSTAYAQG